MKYFRKGILAVDSKDLWKCEAAMTRRMASWIIRSSAKMLSAAMKTGVKLIDFLWCNGSRVGQVPEGNNFILEACEQLNSTWLRAESRTAGAGG